MGEKQENNLLLALRGQAELTRELHEAALASKALSWVTLDLVPRSLQIAFLNAADKIRAEEVTAFLDSALPEHVSYELVESFYGVDAVVRGQLPRGWVLKNLVRPAGASTKIFEDAIEWEVTPVERLWWRDLPAGESGRPGTHFEPHAPEIQEELPRYHLRQLRFIYNATRLPTFPVYVLIEPVVPDGQKALDDNQSRNLLSDLARSDLADPIRDLFLIEKRKPTAPGDVEADIVFRGLSPILKRAFCGVAICEFTDVPRNGHDFRHHLEELHRWRHDLLKNASLAIQNLYFLPFIGKRASYEGGEAVDAAMRIKYSYEKRLQFAHPGFAKNGGGTLTLDLPIGDLVVCGTQLSGRSVLATWVCRQFLAAGYKVVYVTVTGPEVTAPADGPADQKSASLLGKIASQAGPVQYSKQYDVRDVLKASQAPLAIYTEIRESSLLREEPDLFLDWLQSSSPGKLFVMFDEIQKSGLEWVDRLQKQQEEGLHLGFVCRNVDEVPAIMNLAIKRATVIITNLSLSYDAGKPPNLELARALLKLVKRDKPQVPIDAEDLAKMKSNRNFFLFPRPQKNQIRVYPVRGSLPDFDNLDPEPAERILWGSPAASQVAAAGRIDESGSPRTMPKVFISYSWDSEQHKSWVRTLATCLREDGVETILDQWHLVPGDQLPVFMEGAVRDSDYVLIVCTAKYKERSDSRSSGAGYEGDIMTGELLETRHHRKFIPILREGEGSPSMPSWLKGKYYVDLRGEPYSHQQYEDLLTTLLGTRQQAPPVGRPRSSVRPAPVTSVNTPDPAPPSFDPIRITGVIVDEIGKPRGDGAPVYAIPFKLSRQPPSEWAQLFVEAWNEPRRPPTLHRPGIASVQGNRVVLTETTIQEVEQHHRTSLIQAAQEANQRFLELEAQRKAERERIEAANRLKFDE